MHDSTTLKKNNEKDIISAICLYYGWPYWTKLFDNPDEKCLLLYD
jgi:hypothetical protein